VVYNHVTASLGTKVSSAAHRPPKAPSRRPFLGRWPLPVLYPHVAQPLPYYPWSTTIPASGTGFSSTLNAPGYPPRVPRSWTRLSVRQSNPLASFDMQAAREATRGIR
jgi:hypothetical protein